MNKNVFTICLLVLLFGILVACGPILPGNGNLSDEQVPSPVSTEIMFGLTKNAVLTGEVETQTAVSPKNDATITAILATKFAGATQMAETITTEPTQTSTPSIPSDSPFCTPADLKPYYAANGATGNTLLGVGLTLTSNRPCYLQAWPQAILLDDHGNPIDVDYSYQDLGTIASVSPQADETIGLWPGWQAVFNLLWFDYRTWCGKPISGNLIIRLNLMSDGGTIEIPTDFHPGNACDTPGTRNSVSITKMYLEPPPIATPYQIRMFDENHGWMIGGQNSSTSRIFHTNDGGVTWNDVSPSSAAYINDVFYLDEQTAWIASATVDNNIPTIFHTTNAGRSWQEYQNLPFKQASLEFSDPMVGWAFADTGAAAGNLYFSLYQTLDGGASWKMLQLGKPFLDTESGLPPGTIHIINGQSFEFLSPTTIWFGGNQLVSMKDVLLEVSRDSSKTWTEKRIPVPGSDKMGDGMVVYGTPIFITEKDGYVVASYALTDPVSGWARNLSDVIMTHDGGDTWIPSPNLIDEPEGALHIDFISSMDAYFHCSDSICETHDGAQTWSPISSNFNFAPVDDQEALLDLDFVNSEVGWALIYHGDQNRLIKTLDGGTTWIPLQP